MKRNSGRESEAGLCKVESGVESTVKRVQGAEADWQEETEPRVTPPREETRQNTQTWNQEVSWLTLPQLFFPLIFSC